jgi:hypothetical protein
MLINPFQPEWQSDLNRHHAALPHGASLMLLIDGVFVPGLFRKLSSECTPILLFELLPGCSKEARDVSPFVVAFDPSNKSLVRLLTRCNGWPMLSVLVTYESAEELAKRFATCCIVEADGQKFNFRFPDTRRLPTVFETLTQQQRGELIGSAIGWHYIGRDGSWCSLPLKPSTQPLPIPEKLVLDGRQFGQLLSDSEPDEMWVQLLDRGAQTDLLPSQRHDLLLDALRVADKHGLDDILKIAWCMDCIKTAYQNYEDTLSAKLFEWKEKNVGDEN